MNGPKDANPQNLVFYPAYCHVASPTHFTWVKLTTLEVHHSLKKRAGFEGQDIYFYLNHPVQFVCLAGAVVVLEDFHEKRWLLTLDDSSGETIDVLCDKSSNHFSSKSKQDGWDTEPEKCTNILSQIDLGSIIQVKGTISTFRDIRQVHLKRVKVLPDTNAEVEFWRQRVQLFGKVLSKPWYVSAHQQQKLLQEAEDRIAERHKRNTRRTAMEQKDAERIARRYEKEDRKRAEGAWAAKEAALSLQK